MLKNYGFFSAIRLVRDLVFTKLFFNKSRIIRMPFYMRGRKFIKLGVGLTTGVGVRIDAFHLDKNSIPNLTFGDRIEVNDYVHVACVNSIIIGNDVLIASKVYISDHNHGSYSGSLHSDPSTNPRDRKIYSKPVVIGDRVWLGEAVSILPGVSIGKGTIVGANSVVTKSFGENLILAGVPAKAIKVYNFDTKKWDNV